MKHYPSILSTLALLLVACGADRSRTPRNVILICLDTVRADHLGCYGYTTHATTPHLDALAACSTLFETVSATAGWTKPSVPSFLTGTHPMQHGVYLGSARDEAGAASDVLPDQALTLAEVFRAAGYQTAAFVKNAQLRKGLGLEQGFETYQDEAGDAREIRWRACDWLEARAAERPFFLYLHLLDAHWPYPVPEEYATRFASQEAIEPFRGDGWRELRDAVNDGEIELAADRVAALIGLYDGALAWIDAQLGLLFAKLEREGIADDTIVCVIADHGEEFLEHGRIGHGHGLWENLLHVPWILHVPASRARRVEACASLVDLFPTLLTAAGVEHPGAVIGIDRIREPLASATVFAEHLEPGSYQQVLGRGDSKVQRVVRFADGGDAAAPRAPAPVIVPSGRWEAKIEAEVAGGLRATRLRPSADPPDDPTEIKGLIERVEPGRIVIAGVPVAVAATTELYGETHTDDGERRALEQGMLVKAAGAVAADGVFQAQRLKLYALDEEIEHEVRGPLESVAEDGSVVIGGMRVRVDARTEIADAGEQPGRRMSREDVARFLDAESADEPPAGFVASASERDLARDPDELEPPHEPGPRFDDLLRLSNALWKLRQWGASDRASLSPRDLEALKAIGYAE